MPKKILITRPLAQNQGLVDAVKQQGMMPVVLPLMLIEPLTNSTDTKLIEYELQNLASFSAVIFTSTNAAKLFLAKLESLNIRIPSKQLWYGIGAATTHVLAGNHSNIEDNAVAMNSEALLAKTALQKLSGQQVLICRGQGGRHLLRDVLIARGAKVSYCELYCRQIITYPKGALAQLLSRGIDVLTAASGETLQALVEQAKLDNVFNTIKVVPIIVPSLRVKHLAQELEFKKVIQAENAGTKAILQALN